ncbi:Phytochrome-like protein cph2 [Vibrio thalassae]|uniref:Phytochrome-like protein cph2 n=1 Tax=Vibrio thalassae TaxID=1243014 RepID=A0A240EGQ1_9VIBR|nr:EAL domain-containing protein [Vibrio thalassae]SNX47868.1 Phytochrome-like protein cph2 [Vibrio thalassae]
MRQSSGERCGDPSGFELLTRWPHKQLNGTASTLFATADHELGRNITLSVIQQALQFFAKKPIPLNFNFSCAQILLTDSISKLNEIIRETAYPNDMLTLEVTESFSNSDLCALSSVLAQLNAIGIKTSLDDFGAQAASYDRLFTLPLQQVKIDRQFIHAIDCDPRKRLLMQHIVEFVPYFNCQLIAEGVETVDELKALIKAGVNFAQGFYLSHPLDLLSMEAKLG